MFLVFVNGVVLCSYEDEWFGEVHTFIFRLSTYIDDTDKEKLFLILPNGDRLRLTRRASYDDEWFGETHTFIYIDIYEMSYLDR